MTTLGAASSFGPDNSSRLGSDAPLHLGGSDEADAAQKAHFPDYQPLPLFGFAVRRNCYIHRRVPDCRPARALDPALKVAKQAYVQTNSNRKPRRDRLPDYQNCPADG